MTMKPLGVIQMVLLSALFTALKVQWVEGRLPHVGNSLGDAIKSRDIEGNEAQDRHRRQSGGDTVGGATSIMDTLSQQDQSAGSCSQSPCLIGRDGRDGRDGQVGERGPKGEGGDIGAKGGSAINGEKGDKGDAGSPGRDATNPGSVGTTYVRWGRTTCPATSQLVYEGVVGGSLYTHTGGSSKYLCLPLDPEELQPAAGTGGRREYLYTTEYKIYDFPPFSHLHHNDVPCAVCRVIGRSTLLMIPAKTTCPANWTSEYRGYMMSAYHDHAHQTEYVCVDENAEARPGTMGFTNGVMMYLVEATCGSDGLPCVPYVAGNELACVVCTI